MNIQAKLTINTKLDGELPNNETLEQAFFNFINSMVVFDEKGEWEIFIESVQIDSIVVEDGI